MWFILNNWYGASWPVMSITLIFFQFLNWSYKKLFSLPISYETGQPVLKIWVSYMRVLTVIQLKYLPIQAARVSNISVNILLRSLNFSIMQLFFLELKVHITPQTKFRPESPCKVKRSHTKNFRNRTCRFPTIEVFWFWKTPKLWRQIRESLLGFLWRKLW